MRSRLAATVIAMGAVAPFRADAMELALPPVFMGGNQLEIQREGVDKSKISPAFISDCIYTALNGRRGQQDSSVEVRPKVDADVVRLISRQPLVPFRCSGVIRSRTRIVRYEAWDNLVSDSNQSGPFFVRTYNTLKAPRSFSRKVKLRNGPWGQETTRYRQKVIDFLRVNGQFYVSGNCKTFFGNSRNPRRVFNVDSMCSDEDEYMIDEARFSN